MRKNTDKARKTIDMPADVEKMVNRLRIVKLGITTDNTPRFKKFSQCKCTLILSVDLKGIFSRAIIDYLTGRKTSFRIASWCSE